MLLSKLGEVADFQEADQFQAGKSQFECGYFGVAIAKSMAEVGKPPIYSLKQVIDYAEAWYAQYTGSDTISNTSGMSLEQLYSLLSHVQLHWQATNTDINVVKKWLAVGYPVLVALEETSVYDMSLNRNPYPWTPAGNHIILITGITSDNNILVRDSANCTNLYDPNSLRPGPRKYNASKLRLVSATVVVPPWLSRPASANPPAPVKIVPVQPPSQSEQIKTLQDKLIALGRVNDQLNIELTNAEKQVELLKVKVAPTLPPEFMSFLEYCANAYLTLKGN